MSKKGAADNYKQEEIVFYKSWVFYKGNRFCNKYTRHLQVSQLMISAPIFVVTTDATYSKCNALIQDQLSFTSATGF